MPSSRSTQPKETESLIIEESRFPRPLRKVILKVSEDLLEILQITTGELPFTFPVATQDITPYGNGLHHINSILQPSTATNAPVVGLAITTETMVPGCATGASHEIDIALAAKFSLEIAKNFGTGKCKFYSTDEFELGEL